MFNLRFAKDYLRHWLKAKTRHGVHSPFVYRLVDKIIYDFSAKTVYDEIEFARKQLLNDGRMITVADPGAGAHVNNRRKKISDIANNALKPPRLAQLLYRLTNDLQPDAIVELGTFLGVTTLYLQKAAPKAEIYTLEACPQMAEIAEDIFIRTNTRDLKLITGNFATTFPNIIGKLGKLDLVYINENQQKEATLKYFEWCLPRVHERTLLIFDDIYRNEGTKEAWTEIKAHPKVTVTIDLFWIGLVYFKKGQARENFLIRF